MIKLPSILVNSSVYTILSVLQKAINFFLLPLYTIYLTPADYGIINVVIAVCSLLTFLLTFSLQGASSRFYYKYKDDEARIKAIWGTNFAFIILNSFIWLYLIIISRQWILDKIMPGIEFYPIIFTSLIGLLFSPIYLYYQTYLQTTEKAFSFSLNGFLYFILNLSLTIILVVVYKQGAFGVILSLAITNLIFGIYSIIELIKRFGVIFKIQSLKESLAYSLPLLPHNLSGWINGMLDKLFINNLVGLTSVGLYGIGSQFGAIVNMLGLGVNQAYVPWFFKNSNSIEGKNKIRLFSNAGIAALSLITIGIICFSKEILLIMTTTKFHSAWPCIIVLCLANLLDCYYYFYVSVLFLEKTKLLAALTISISIFGALVNWFLIDRFGYMGAAFAFFAIQLIKSILILYFCVNSSTDIKFNWKLHYGELALLIIISGIVYMSNILISSFIIGLALKTIIIIATSFLLFMINKNTLIYCFNKVKSKDK